MSTKTKYLVLSLLTFLLLNESTFSQKAVFKNIEQVSLVTDRNLYLSGESIWFSASYTIPADTSLTLSKVLYVELFGIDNNVVASQKLIIKEGIANGNLNIPEQAITGYYKLRAYTRYQENFEPWQLTTVILSVINPFHPLPVITLSHNEEPITIASMANGNIAYRIEEAIYNEVRSVELFVNESTISEKGIYYSNGIGRFNRKVNKDDQFHILIMLKSGDTLKSQTFLQSKIPVELSTTRKSNELELSFKNVSLPDQELQISLLNITSRQYYSQKVKVIDNHMLAKYPINKIGAGMLLISIKDTKDSIFLEEFCYVAQKKENVDIMLTDSLVVPNQTLSIDMTEFKPEDFPLAVSFVLKGTHFAKSQLLPKYLINNPLYIDDYVTNNMLASQDVLDQIAISVTLSRDNLLQILNKQRPNSEWIVPEINGLTLQGVLLDSVSQQPMQDELIYCSILGQQHQFHVSKSSADGSFVIPLYLLSKQHDIYLAINNNEGERPDIKIVSGYSPIPPPWVTSPFILDSSSTNLITNMYLNYQVNQLFNSTRSQIEEHISSGRPVFGNNLEQIILDDYIQMSSMPEIFNELVPFVRVRKKDEHFEFIISDNYLNIKYYDPLILVDQIVYNNIDKLMELQPTEIERIDVASNVYAYGNQFFNSIINITTNTGNFAGLPLSNDGVFVEYETLKPDICFIPFSSLHNTSGEANFANTVYWNIYDKHNDSKKLLITAPDGIAEYEILLTSLKNKSKIIGKQKIRVIPAQL